MDKPGDSQTLYRGLAPRSNELGHNAEYSRLLGDWTLRTPASLAFQPVYEQQFLQDRARDYLPLIRRSAAIAVAFFIVFLGFDALTFKAYAHAWIWWPLLGVCTASALIMFLASFHPWGVQRIHWIAPLVVAANACAMVWIAYMGARQGVTTPYEVLIVHFLYDFFLLGIRFIIAVPMAMLTVVAYALSTSIAGLDLHLWFESSAVLSGMVLLGSMACRVLEYTERRAWLQSCALQEAGELDSVTGLLNHRAFYDRFERLLRQARRDECAVTLAIIDLDHFKEYNDSHGHVEGDDCLRKVAELLNESARRPLDMVSRMGGDEFAVVWFNTSRFDAFDYAEQLRERIHKLRLLCADARKTMVTVSIGVSSFERGEHTSAEWLVRVADSAMYRAKQAGGNLIYSEPRVEPESA